ncbi:retrovirus-related pol polyprotein from transposon TNT 1-94, partial [Tanacetum coccineum]
ERPWLSKAEGFILPNHDTGRILPAESQIKVIDPSVAVTDSSVTDYDLANESSVCSTPLPPLEKLAGAELVSGPKIIKSILKSNSTFKVETLKASKRNSAPAGKLKNVKIEDDIPLTCDHAKYMSTINMSQHLKSQGGSSSRSQTSRPLKPFPPCKHYGFNDHQSDDYVNYPTCEICGSYDHDTKGHNRIISLRRGIKPRNPPQVTKSCETCGSNVHTTTYHNDIDWFRRGEALQAKKAESSNATRSKTPTKRSINYEKYTLVIVDEYSRYTWVYFLKNKSHAPETIISFIKRVENQNDIKVKQLRTDNGTKFKNSILVNICDEKGISQNFSSPYTPEQNGVAERKNRTLIEAARTMLSGSVFSKQYWTEAVATACYTQNRTTIVKRNLKNPFKIFCGRLPNIDFLHVFGCPIFIHNHEDHLGKFDEKADDGYFLGYSLVSKAFSED